MNKFFKINNDTITVDCKLLSNYTDALRITLNDKIFLEQEINENIIINREDVNNGDNLKLYIKKNDTWFYAENMFVSLKKYYALSDEKIKKYISEFENLIGECIND